MSPILISGIFTPGRHISSLPELPYSFPRFSHPADTLPRLPGSHTHFRDFHPRQIHFLASRSPILISVIFTPPADTLPRFPGSHTHFRDFYTRQIHFFPSRASILSSGIFTPGRNTSSLPGLPYSFPRFSHPADTLPRFPGSHTHFRDFHTGQTHFLASRAPILISGIFTPGRYTTSLPGFPYSFPGFSHTADTLPPFPSSHTQTHFSDPFPGFRAPILISGIFTPGRHTSSLPGLPYSFP